MKDDPPSTMQIAVIMLERAGQLAILSIPLQQAKLLLQCEYKGSAGVENFLLDFLLAFIVAWAITAQAIKTRYLYLQFPKVQNRKYRLRLLPPAWIVCHLSGG